MSFQTITILGPGLLGGSVALAAQAAGLKVTLWGRNVERVAAASALGLEATTDLVAAVREAQLIIFAVPVGAMEGIAQQALPYLRPDVLVTDVGSVKSLPHEKLEPILKAEGISFIGSHPMAGSEQTGVAAARADLLQGAACVLTNDAGVSEEIVNQMERFWASLGCRPQLMSAADHDRAVARISHFPHAMAVFTADAALKNLEDANLAGGGFRDTSRVASGDPAMWAEIMIENRQALADSLRDGAESLREMLVMLENSDKEGLRDYLAEIKARRDTVR